MSLFGGTPSQARSRNLVEFKAGKMNLRGTMVHPDKRKGLVYLYQSSDMLMHLCWKERSSNNPEDDLVIFPDEIEFKKVTQNTTGRVYILKWRSNARKLFFWMQESKDDKDEELCKKVNDTLNNPPSPGFGDEAGGAGGGAHPLQSLMERMTGGGPGGLDPSDLSNVLRGMNPSELASLISSVGNGGGAPGLMPDAFSQQTPDSRPSTAPVGNRSTGTAVATPTASAGTTSTARTGDSSSKPRTETAATSASASAAAAVAAAAATGNRNTQIQMSALTNILANLSGNSGSPAAAAKPAIDLYDIMNSENLVPILSNKDVQEKLRAHLPEGTALPSTEKELRDSIQSPQFRQAVSVFSMTLQTGQLGPVLAQFGLPEEAVAAANQGDLQAFAQAMEKHYRKNDDKKPSDTTMDTS